MLTAEENDLLTRVGPGSLAGELFRRYWQPVAMAPELSDETPTKFVRILGEDLVLFRDRSGRAGLLADHCSHRGASLLYGRVEQRGIACAYHGWLYDTTGNVLECPAEPAGSMFHLTVKHRAYPVRERYGIYWTYMGPPPVPVFPRYDVAESGPVKAVKLVPQRDCNWLQIVENHLDQAHIFILHQSTGKSGIKGLNSTRGHIDDLATLDYVESAVGIKRTQVLTDGYSESDLLIFPSTQRIFNFFALKVPIDDTHTRQFSVFADLSADGSAEREGRTRGGTYQTFGGVGERFMGSLTSDGQGGATVEYTIEWSTEGKTPPDAVYPHAKYRMDTLRFQDFTMLESQGTIAHRENEHLATSDRGLVLLRSILKREIEKVQQGLDPIGVLRDPEHDVIDTYIGGYIGKPVASR